jgi:glyoxylase-like metal-dependent hydrolase (beta-lactamase superfamily II)
MACSEDDSLPATTTPSTLPESTTTPTTTPETTSPQPTEPVTTTPLETDAVQWERVNLGFVSAYVLARRGEAAVVDTGVSGSEGDIEASLAQIGLGWESVGHVIVTHLHQDHQGSLPAVMNTAAAATAYAGAADIPEISSPRPITAVGDGDTVFDLEIIDTPGHTPGHISVLDRVGGLLVAGDALNGADGGVIGANPEFTQDIPMADDSVRKLATFTYDTVVFGHGEPVVGLASQQVAELAASI